MTEIDRTTDATNVSRRGFLAGSAGLSFAFAVPGFIGGMSESLAAATDAAQKTIGGWVTIATDGGITIAAPAAEMGQGIFTALPMILAEELDADWSKVKAEFPPPNAAVFGNPKFGNTLYTVASWSVDGYWDKMRMAGAQARRVLMQAAADKWGVPLGEVKTEPSMVVHPASGRRMSYGEIAAFAQVPAEMPQLTAADLKKPSEYRIIGKSTPRLDIPAKTNGSAQYALDVQVPDMVYATLLRSPVEGAAPQTIDESATLAVPGVLRTVKLKDAVAIVGTSVEAVFKGRDALKVTWNGGSAAGYDSTKASEEYAARARNLEVKGLPFVNKGDAEAALSTAATVVSGEYRSDYVYHAQMEPMNCTAKVDEAGDGAEIWFGTQAPTPTVTVAAAVLQTKPEKIRFHQHFLGGGYGRRAQVDMVPYTLLIAKEVKRPVKLIYTREQDVRAARMRPMTAHFLRAGFDDKGNLVAWKHRMVGESVIAYTAPARLEALKGLDPSILEGTNHRYEVDNKAVEYLRESRGAALASWRGVGAGYNKFVVESFIDELAAAQKTDPVAFRLKLLANNTRARKVIETAAEMANWGRPVAQGRALGFSFVEYTGTDTKIEGTLTAGIIEISLDRETGKIRAHRFWSAVDPGIVVNPDTILALTEGNVVFGLSQVLKERMTLAEGRVQQSNFADYPVLRMSEVPEIETRIVASDNRPTGIGEIALPLIAGAVGNAVFALTGKRLRHMPFTPERVKQALA
jgi:isoquinoline 1-oxidoreductase beta subunit